MSKLRFDLAQDGLLCVLKPLRTCPLCGLQAHTEADLELFMKDRTSRYGRNNRCKKCHSEERKQTQYRTNEFIKIFRTRSPDGLIRCHFCNEKITKLEGRDGASLGIHSIDGNHENWKSDNKVPSHGSCHMRYHNTGEKHYTRRRLTE